MVANDDVHIRGADLSRTVAISATAKQIPAMTRPSIAIDYLANSRVPPRVGAVVLGRMARDLSAARTNFG